MHPIGLLPLLLLLLAAGPSVADDGSTDTPNWPGFRGPEGSGVASGDGLPVAWSETESVLWSTEVPGRGWSSPVVWGDRVFLTTAVSEGELKQPSTGIFGNEDIARLIAEGKSEQEAVAIILGRDLEKTGDGDLQVRFLVIAYDVATGAELWRREAHRGVPPGGRHRKNTYASETPVTDGERIYALFGNIGLYTYSLDGELLWKRELEPRPIYLDFGTASSPAVDERHVYVLNDNDEEAYLLALDRATGEEAWRVVRSGEGRHSAWSTPFVWRHEGGSEIVAVGVGHATSYDPDTGKELWTLGGLSLVPTPTPIAAGNLLYLAGGAPEEPVRPLVAVRRGARGDITPDDESSESEWIAWSQERAGSYIPSPIAYGERLYVLYDKGFLAAFDAASGEEIFEARIGRGGVTFSASPWAYDDMVFALSEEGCTFVFRAGDEYELLGTNDLDEMSLATPAIARDSLFIRTMTRLYRIGVGDAPDRSREP